MNVNAILNKTRFSYDWAERQTDLFTRSHVLYKCVIVSPARRRFTFSYQCNPNHKRPNLKDCLHCLITDADCYEGARDVDDFLREFGYDGDLESVRKGEKAFKACGHTAKALARLFTADELETLRNFFAEY